MKKCITYALAYIPHMTVSLCKTCEADPKIANSRGSLGPVQHGAHMTTCSGCEAETDQEDDTGKIERCQQVGCENDACWETVASNERRPGMGRTVVCSLHLVEPGLCPRSDISEPGSWTVVPIHKGSPPYCLATCPTCHPRTVQP